MKPFHEDRRFHPERNKTDDQLDFDIRDVAHELKLLGIDDTIIEVITGCREDNYVACMFRTSDLIKLRELRQRLR